MPGKRPLVVGVDLGGTNIQTAAVRNGRVLARKKKKTRAEEGADAVVGRIVASIEKVIEKADADEGEFEGICIGAPGAVDALEGIVREAPNLDWQDVPLGPRLEEKTGLPVLLANDVNVGLIGEHVHGAGRGALHMAAVFVGTGIGGGLVTNGALHSGARGAAGEIGHVVVEPNGRKCPCGRKGCVEAYASKTAMEAMVREGIDEGRKSVVLELMEKKGKTKLTSSVVEKALAEEDPLMGEAVQTAQHYLGLLVGDLVNAFDPEVIVFGGGLVDRLGADFLKPIAATARQRFLQQANAERIRIVPAELGDDAGPMGAAVTLERHFAQLAS